MDNFQKQEQPENDLHPQIAENPEKTALKGQKAAKQDVENKVKQNAAKKKQSGEDGKKPAKKKQPAKVQVDETSTNG